MNIFLFQNIFLIFAPSNKTFKDMPNINQALHTAKRAKNDEFYTRLPEIERECRHYKPLFKNKIILCNCNDAEHKGFITYFVLNFEILGIKELICTSFTADGSPAYIYRYKGGTDKSLNLSKWEKKQLSGNGSFNSEEGIILIGIADIIVTNPPFSLFRDFISLIMSMNKKFLVIGNMNAITYKEVFPLIKDNLMWLGVTNFNTGMYFNVSEDFQYAKTYKNDRVRDGQKVNRVPGCCWFTNLDHTKRHEPLDLYKKYSEKEYHKYDNYDAINVDKVSDIPIDYNGYVGVPITFLDKYCPEQFEIVKFRKGDDDKDLSINGVCPYFRILIKKKQK